MSRRQRRGALRQAILDTADELLFTLGDARDVSIEAIVAAVGCTPPALYHYFPSKDELLLEVCRRRYEDFAVALEADLPRHGSPVDELIARGHAYLDWAVTHPEHYRILFMTPVAASQATAAADPLQGAGLAELVTNLRRAMDEGAIARVDPLPAVLALWSAVHGMASLAVANPTLPRDLAHAVVELTGRSIVTTLAAGR